MLNQWTFQARMYNAARYVCQQPDMELVQLVSFGCGTDAITGDEMRSILEEGGRLYTVENRRHQQPGSGEDPGALPDSRHGGEKTP